MEGEGSSDRPRSASRQDSADLVFLPSALRAPQDFFRERAIERERFGVGRERVGVRAHSADVAARDGSGERFVEGTLARRGHRALREAGEHLAGRVARARPRRSRRPRRPRRRRPCRRRRATRRRDTAASPPARGRGAAPRRRGRSPRPVSAASGSPSTATKAPLQSSLLSPVKGRTGWSEPTAAPRRARGARTPLERAPERCRATRHDSREARASPTVAMASSETARMRTSQLRVSGVEPASLEATAGMPASSAGRAAVDAPSRTMRKAMRPPAPSQERAKARPARPAPASARRESRISAATARSLTALFGIISTLSTQTAKAGAVAQKSHADTRSPKPRDPEGDHPRPRRHGTPGVFADALQVEPLRPVAGLDPQHHGRPDGLGLPGPAAHLGGPRPDRPRLPRLHRRAHAAAEGRRRGPRAGRLRPGFGRGRRQPALHGGFTAAFAAFGRGRVRRRPRRSPYGRQEPALPGGRAGQDPLRPGP